MHDDGYRVHLPHPCGQKYSTDVVKFSVIDRYL